MAFISARVRMKFIKLNEREGDVLFCKQSRKSWRYLNSQTVSEQVEYLSDISEMSFGHSWIAWVIENWQTSNAEPNAH